MKILWFFFVFVSIFLEVHGEGFLQGNIHVGRYFVHYTTGKQVEFIFQSCLRDPPSKIVGNTTGAQRWPDTFNTTILNITAWDFTALIQRTDRLNEGWGQDTVNLKWKAYFGSGKSHLVYNPCRNGGSCTNTNSGQVCQCQTRFTGKRCQTRLIHCYPNPCQNGATCRERRNGFRCECLTGFWGRRCLKRYLEGTRIVDQPTNHNTSQIELNLFYHDCYNETAALVEAMATNKAFEEPQIIFVNAISQFGFQGRLRERRTLNGPLAISWKAYFNKQVSVVSMCENRGVCENSDEGHQCRCSRLFGGERCGELLPPCAHQPCQNGGYCTNIIDTFHCSCREGFGGSDCSQHLVSGVVMVPWGNEYRRRRMQVLYDQCHSVDANRVVVTVRNLGNYPLDFQASIVTVSRTGFFTFIQRGQGGRQRPRSQLNVTWTAYFAQSNYTKNPCMNEATCSNTGGRQTCHCTPGFKGTLCDTVIRNCSSNPCKNNGSCTDGTDGFVCECQAGYEGEDCSLRFLRGRAYVGPNYEGRPRYKTISVVYEKCYRYRAAAIHASASGSTAGLWPDTYRVGILDISSYGFTARVARTDIRSGWAQNVTINWKAIFNAEKYDVVPCTIGARCEDGENGRWCTCDAGYSGRYCEIRDHCNPNPCQYGGTCINAADGFKCSCSSRFFGQNCTIETEGEQI